MSRRPDPRSPAVAVAQSARVRTAAAERRAGASPLTDERRGGGASGRSPRKATLLILAGVIAVAGIVAVVLFSGGGSPSKGSSTASSGTTVTAGKTRSTAHHKSPSKSAKSAVHAANPAETIVTVLNGTETAGLAHRISVQLQQQGYSQAEALSGAPGGAHPVTVVQYAPGHQGDAEGVAHTLGVTEVQPLEAAVASLAGTAKVVVIVGADQAAKAP